MSVSARFWPKVQGGSLEDCWEWQAALRPDGYGVIGVGRKTVRAHRWAYEELRAEIPVGLILDHLCRNRRCVNPWHLEPVTPKVNAKRGEWGMKEECPAGHAYDDQNTGRRANRAGRECITCRNEQKRARREALRVLLDLNPDGIQHGTLTIYNDWLCRCQECRDAHADYRRTWRARRAAA